MYIMYNYVITITRKSLSISVEKQSTLSFIPPLFVMGSNPGNSPLYGTVSEIKYLLNHVNAESVRNYLFQE